MAHNAIGGDMLDMRGTQNRQKHTVRVKAVSMVSSGLTQFEC